MFPGVIGALAKVERVLPDPVRRRVCTLEETVLWDLGGQPGTGSPDTDIVLSLSTAVREHRRVLLHHRKANGDETKRLFEPFGLVCRRDYWYAIGHCHLRGEQRLFRLDRVRKVAAQIDIFARP